jgi:hypothetical protein
MCSTPWSLNFSPSSVPPDGNEETDFFKNSKYASSAKCACSLLIDLPEDRGLVFDYSLIPTQRAGHASNFACKRQLRSWQRRPQHPRRIGRDQSEQLVAIRRN